MKNLILEILQKYGNLFLFIGGTGMFTQAIWDEKKTPKLIFPNKKSPKLENKFIEGDIKR